MSRRVAARVALGDRDMALLGDVGRLRFLSGDQVTRLHFAAGTEVGRRRRAQASLCRLTDDGYLFRLPRRVGGAGSGSDRFVYQLGYRGQRVVWPNRRARTPDETGWLFVEHSLAISALVVELVESERAGRCSDLKIETEPAVWRHYVGRHGRAVVLKPDLAVQLVTGTEAASGSEPSRLVWFVEVDRATEGLKRIRAKAGQYLDYWRSGREQQRPELQGVFPRVLWSVPDETRAEGLRRALRVLPAPATEMLVVSVAAETTRALLGETTTNGPGTEGGET